LVEVDLTVGFDGETGVRVGVVRRAGAIDGADRCKKYESIIVKRRATPRDAEGRLCLEKREKFTDCGGAPFVD